MGEKTIRILIGEKARRSLARYPSPLILWTACFCTEQTETYLGWEGKRLFKKRLPTHQKKQIIKQQ